MSEKMWGAEPFWGLGYDWDPDWVLTDRQKELRATLIELCEKEMRANAKRSDDELLYPAPQPRAARRARLPRADASPRSTAASARTTSPSRWPCETIARYGCASTAMCYVMHMGAVQAIMLRPTPELIDKYIRPLNSGLIGTLSYSDPETGSHFWYPVSSRAERLERRLQDQQEGVVDDVGRVRRLLRPADDEPRLQGLRRPLGVRRRQGALRGAAVALGRARAARQPVGRDLVHRRRDPRNAARRARGRRRRRRTTRRSTRGS